MYIYFHNDISHFGKALAKQFNLEEVGRGLMPEEGKEIFFFGIYDYDDFVYLMQLDCRVHLFWGGSDVPWCEAHKLFPAISEKRNIRHLAGSRLIQRELNRNGIDSIFTTTFARNLDSVPYTKRRWDKGIHVMVYQPGKGLYCPKEMIELAEKMPEVKFHWVADKNKVFKDLPKNIKNHGYLSTKPYIKLLKKCQIVVRYTLHDGFSDTIIEAILSGAYVISNHDYPFVVGTSNVDEIVEAINKLKEQKPPNDYVAWYYRHGGFINNPNLLFGQEKKPTISVGIVKSDRNDEWFNQAISSIKNQSFPAAELIVLNNPIDENKKYRYSVGEAFNKLADKATGDFIFFMGDDDIVSSDILHCMINQFYETERAVDCVVSSHTHVTIFNEDGYAWADKIPTGMWKTDFVKHFRFDEKKKKHVDTEFINRTRGMGFITAIARHHVGYYYRQHDNMVSGNKIKRLSQEQKGKMEKENNE